MKDRIEDLDRWFDFDVTDDVIPLKETLRELKRCLRNKRAAIIDVDPEGPGGGWPNVTVYCSADDGERVKRWLLENRIAWSDQDGVVHDYPV